MRRIKTINKIETKIKYLLVTGKIYEVISTDFINLTLEASETDLLVSDVPADEVFDLADFKEFRVRLRNWKGNIVKFPGIEDKNRQ